MDHGLDVLLLHSGCHPLWTRPYSGWIIGVWPVPAGKWIVTWPLIGMDIFSIAICMESISESVDCIGSHVGRCGKCFMNVRSRIIQRLLHFAKQEPMSTNCNSDRMRSLIRFSTSRVVKCCLLCSFFYLYAISVRIHLDFFRAVFFLYDCRMHMLVFHVNEPRFESHVWKLIHFLNESSEFNSSGKSLETKASETMSTWRS